MIIFLCIFWFGGNVLAGVLFRVGLDWPLWQAILLPAIVAITVPLEFHHLVRRHERLRLRRLWERHQRQ